MFEKLDLAGLWVPFCMAACLLVAFHAMERAGEIKTKRRTERVLQSAEKLQRAEDLRITRDKTERG